MPPAVLHVHESYVFAEATIPKYPYGIQQFAMQNRRASTASQMVDECAQQTEKIRINK